MDRLIILCIALAGASMLAVWALGAVDVCRTSTVILGGVEAHATVCVSRSNAAAMIEQVSGLGNTLTPR
jgi:hypothetical protein